jgi:hypothetical protein
VNGVPTNVSSVAPSATTNGETTASAPAATKSNTAGTYTLGTKLGADIYDKVKSSGASMSLSDGTVLSLDSNGNVVATKKGTVYNTNVTYKPETGDDYADELRAAYDTYDRIAEEQKKAQKAATDSAVASLEGQKQKTETSYADLFRQLYINKMNSQKNLNQQLAARGVTGGAAETTALGMATSYADALRQGVQEKTGTINELDTAITQTKLSGDTAAAQIAADAAEKKLNSYTAVLKTLMDREDKKATAADEQLSANRSYTYQMAMMKLNDGEMVDDAVLEAAGIPKETARAIVNNVISARQNAAVADQAAEDQTKAERLLVIAIKNGADVLTPEQRQFVEGIFDGIPLEALIKAYDQN